MKIINKNKVEKFLKKVSFKETIFVLDFDGTITTTGDGGSFSPINTTKAGPSEFMNAIGNYYYPIEKATKFSDIDDGLTDIDEVLANSGISFEDFRHIMMQQRWHVTMQIGVKFKLDIDNYSVEGSEFRGGMEHFLNYLYDHNIDYLIVSAGVKNYIRNFFVHHGFKLDKMQIVGNEFTTDNEGRAISYNKDLINPFTKQHLDYRKYSFSEKKFAIQFGDSLGDAHIVNDHFKSENVLTIGITSGDASRLEGFCDTFDIVLENKDGGIEEVLELLNISI